MPLDVFQCQTGVIKNYCWSYIRKFKIGKLDRNKKFWNSSNQKVFQEELY